MEILNEYSSVEKELQAATDNSASNNSDIEIITMTSPNDNRENSRRNKEQRNKLSFGDHTAMDNNFFRKSCAKANANTQENYKSNDHEVNKPNINISPPTKRVARQQKRQRGHQVTN